MPNYGNGCGWCKGKMRDGLGEEKSDWGGRIRSARPVDKWTACKDSVQSGKGNERGNGGVERAVSLMGAGFEIEMPWLAHIQP